jgi:hypothetical protein
MGFHVVMLHPPPPHEEVAGQRVVIRYTGTLGAGDVARTRADAMQRAQEVLRLAKAGTAFEQLVTRYSEGEDRSFGGELGRWATDEPAPEPTIVDALTQVTDGEVIDGVLESVHGLQVVKRVAREDRPLAVDAVVIESAADSSAPDPRALEEARQLIAAARTDEGALSHRPHQVGGAFRLGGGDPVLTQIALGLAIGEVTPQPVPIEHGFVVARRKPIDPGWPWPPVLYELPRPSTVAIRDLETFIHDSSAGQLGVALGQVGPAVIRPLPEAQRSAVASLLSELVERFTMADSGEQRVQAYREGMRAIRATVGAERYGALVAGIQDWLAAQMMALDRS